MNFYNLAWCFSVTLEQQWIISLSERLSIFRLKDLIYRHPSSSWSHKMVLMQQQRSLGGMITLLHECPRTGKVFASLGSYSSNTPSVYQCMTWWFSHQYQICFWLIIIPSTTFVTPLNQHALAPSAVLSLTVTDTPSDLCAVIVHIVIYIRGFPCFFKTAFTALASVQLFYKILIIAFLN